jgi:hypothetical protein
VIAHDVKPGAVAFPCAFQVIVDPLKAPLAVPATFSSFAHVAEKFPLAVVLVCCVTFHWKSLHELGDGTTPDDDQLPNRALMPVADGPSVLLRSNPKQPAEAAARDNTAISTVFFMSRFRLRARCSRGPLICRYRPGKGQSSAGRGGKYTMRIPAQIRCTRSRRHFDFELCHSFLK